MKKIYFISGLGADERVFRFLSLKAVQKTVLPWLPPGLKSKTKLARYSLEEYARALATLIKNPKESVLIGVSFGGIVAGELARLLCFKKVIILSSVKSRKELGPLIRFAAFTRLYKLIPPQLYRHYNFLVSWLFSVSDEKEKQLLRQIIRDTDPEFAQWAIRQIMNWKPPVPFPLKDIIHIHGTADRIFPVKRITNPLCIKGGGHFMVVSHAKEVSRLMNRKLRSPVK